MFDVTGTKSLDSNAITFVDEGINFIGRTFEDNGRQGKIEKQDFEPNEPNTITATVIGNYKYVKYQTEPYYCSQNINKLKPKDIIKKWNKEIAYFFVTYIQKFVSQYDYQQAGYKLNDIINHVLELPVKNGNIDYDFMIDLISELEEERISELKKYLKVKGFDSYALNPEEEKAFADFKNLNWGEFNYAELFELLKIKNKLNKMQLDENGKYDVYSAISTNNGIMGKTLVEPEYTVDELIPYYVCFGDHTRKFSIAKSSFSVMDNVKVLKTIETTELKSILFIITTWQKGIKDLGYSRHWKLAKNTKILLPIDSNGNIDYEYMNVLISAIQKEVIKGVVDYADKNIDATKKVVRK